LESGLLVRVRKKLREGAGGGRRRRTRTRRRKGVFEEIRMCACCAWEYVVVQEVFL
jgi:hypothetical protein